MKMIASRIATSHTYNEDVAAQIASDTQNLYFGEFVKLYEKLKVIRKEQPRAPRVSV
jgi:hypothetical protein